MSNIPLRSQASFRLQIVIVGAGLGGLAAAHCLSQAGHHVTVLERTRTLREVGAGIQVGSNLSRLLVRWGLGDKLEQIGVSPSAITLRRWCTGERIGWTPWGDNLSKRHGSPYYVVHRADIHSWLVELVRSHPSATIRLNSKVVSIDATNLPSVTLESGEIIHADMILGADGLHSMVRDFVTGERDKPIPTGDAAYRVLIPAEKLKADPSLAPLLDDAEVTGWMGPGGHIAAYPIQSKNLYNMVLVHSDSHSLESWTEGADVELMRKEFAGWEPRVQKLLDLATEVLDWKLMVRPSLKTWVHDSGKVALLGDAAHPMLPYRAQGSAMAIEDAAVLGSLFSHISSPSQITPFLQAYQSIRYERATAMQQSSRLNQHILHLPDGHEQEVRDASMRRAMIAALWEARGDRSMMDMEMAGNSNQWADRSKMDALFNYDAEKVAHEWWKTKESSIIISAEESRSSHSSY